MVEYPEWYDGKNVNDVKFCEEPVSYTHLDVYKRQRTGYVDRNEIAWKKLEGLAVVPRTGYVDRNISVM